MKRNLKLVLFAFTILAAAPAAAEVPAPCRAAGYELKTLDSDFSRGDMTFDESGSYQPGYQWYRWNWFKVKADHRLSGRHSDGSVSARGNLDGHLVSAAMSSRAPGFVGNAFGGGACIEVKLRFDPSPRASNEAHPSFWAMSKEHLDGSGDDHWPGKNREFTHFAEWDILEYYKARPPGFLSSWIDWFGPYIAEGELRLGERICSRPFCKRSGALIPYSGAFPADTDWNKWQTLIGVWVAATADHPGCIQTFLNNLPTTTPHCWKRHVAPQEQEQMEDLLDFSVIDRHHMVLVISSGDSPIFVRSVQVYQKSASNNLSN